MQTKKLFAAAVGALLIAGTLAGLANPVSSKGAGNSSLPAPSSQQAVVAASIDLSTPSSDPYLDGAFQGHRYNADTHYGGTGDYYGAHEGEEYEAHTRNHQREHEEEDD